MSLLRQTSSLQMQFLEKYLATVPSKRKFVACTDEEATTEFLKNDIDGDSLADLGDEDQQTAALELLKKPVAHGDRHLKNLLAAPAEYGVRAGLVHAALRAFFKIKWNPSNPLSERLRLDILDGKVSDSSAFIVVKNTKDCDMAGISTKVPAKVANISAIVYSQTAADLRRREIASFLASQTSGVDAAAQAVLYSSMTRMAQKGLDLTLKSMLKEGATGASW
eukprot:Cvel_33241.t1-p1 / transcript=Cvel_33241.t1 / gene=Cvel_33241 / organism=Chromera_velia_CCMP2878 / gene_product=hypothetical protein / transcript_product=hypothetical protein / location=Cvel_scaffold5351:2322-3154(-) / protein_length=221 / sequence_SO=supercontig / SO=protein_coding / is_pseudo=false